MMNSPKIAKTCFLLRLQLFLWVTSVTSVKSPNLPGIPQVFARFVPDSVVRRLISGDPKASRRGSPVDLRSRCGEAIWDLKIWNSHNRQMGMDQYLLIPFLVGWTSIYQLFWCSPGVQGFDTLPYDFRSHMFLFYGNSKCSYIYIWDKIDTFGITIVNIWDLKSNEHRYNRPLMTK